MTNDDQINNLISELKTLNAQFIADCSNIK